MAAASRDILFLLIFILVILAVGMISSIGFLPGGISIEKLRDFVADDDVARSLEHLNIPIVDRSKVPCDDDAEESEEIVENDIVIFCTPNEDDVSFLQFHVQNRECTNMFLHHDAYVFSTIIDSECVVIDEEPYVALGTFEHSIMVFSPLVRNPVIPQILLEGHEDVVMSLKCCNGALFSGSSDSSIIEWDVGKLRAKSRVTAMGPVDRIGIFGSSLIYSVKDTLYCLGETIDFGGEIERISIRENLMLVSDSTGTLRCYDLRNVSDAVKEKKVHEDSITGLDVLGSDVYTASLDGSIRVTNLDTFDVRSDKDTGEKLFSLRTSSDGFYVYGGEKNELSLNYICDTAENE